MNEDHAFCLANNLVKLLDLLFRRHKEKLSKCWQDDIISYVTIASSVSSTFRVFHHLHKNPQEWSKLEKKNGGNILRMVMLLYFARGANLCNLTLEKAYSPK